jgi:hypothetical protein
MVKLVSLFSLSLLVSCTLTNFYVQAQENSLPTIGVYAAVVAPSVKKAADTLRVDTQEMTRQIEEGLRATRRFKLIERDSEVMKETIITEQEFAKTVNTEGGRAKGNDIETDQLNNIGFLIRPMIVSLNLTAKKMPQDEDPGKYRYTCTGSVSVTIKLLDTTSGEIKFQTTKESSSQQANKPLAAACRNVTSEDQNAAVVDAWRALARDGAQKITNAVVGSLFPIQVMQMRGADIFVNRGEGGGINIGDVYEIFSAGEELIDPVTKEKLGDAEEFLGDVEIVRVNPKFSIARPKSRLAGPPVKAGDILRIK